MSSRTDYNKLDGRIDELEERIDELEEDIVARSDIREVVDDYVERITSEIKQSVESKYQVRADVQDEIMNNVDQIVHRDLAEVVKRECKYISDRLLVELARKAIGLEGKK